MRSAPPVPGSSGKCTEMSGFIKNRGNKRIVRRHRRKRILYLRQYFLKMRVTCQYPIEK